MLSDASSVWILRERAVPADVCTELADRIEWEMFNTASTSCPSVLPTSVDIDDPALVLSVWEHLQELVPLHFEHCALIGPHPTLRLLRYEGTFNATSAGTFHPLHADTPLSSPGAHSRLTVLVYVNSKFSGGSLRFPKLAGTNGKIPVTVDPSEGTALIFDHRLQHCAEIVTCGTKRLIKLSVLYASEPENDRPTGQMFFVEAGQRARLSSALSPACNAVGSGRLAADDPFSSCLAMTNMNDFAALVTQAGLEQDHFAMETARGRLLAFVLEHDLSAWPKEIVARAFLPMAMALTSPRLKLQAYRAFDAVKLLHGDERCILLGETLMKDSVDPDPRVRVAVLNALFSTLAHAFDETFRGDIVARMFRQDPSPSIRSRALEGLVALAEKVGKGQTEEEAAESAYGLLAVCKDALIQVSVSEASTENLVYLADRALALLSAPVSHVEQHVSNTGETTRDPSGPDARELLPDRC